MVYYTIKTLKKACHKKALKAQLHSQIEAIIDKLTKNKDPYKEVRVFDSFNRLTVRAWSSSDAFKQINDFKGEDFVAINGDWSVSENFGLEVNNWNIRLLDKEEIEVLLSGSPSQLEKVNADLDFIKKEISEILDPRLKKLCEHFIKKYEDKLLQTAAARTYHHARRGGLIEHCAQMMRAGIKLSEVYNYINIDLLKTGILFHDSGKLWETSYKKNSFMMPHSQLGEMMGHINLGIELVNSLWREIFDESDGTYQDLEPSSNQVRIHLLHLVASHHGEFEWGAPVLPKTPEAIILHFIDNIDAKLEMFKEAYENSNEIEKNIFEKKRPLRQNYIAPLTKINEIKKNKLDNEKKPLNSSKEGLSDVKKNKKKPKSINDEDDFPEFIPEPKV